LLQVCLSILILLNLVYLIEFCRTPIIMKFASRFQLGILLRGKHLVPPGHDILLGLLSPFLMDQVEALIIYVVKLP
jgi:hypothetical protein